MKQKSASLVELGNTNNKQLNEQRDDPNLCECWEWSSQGALRKGQWGVLQTDHSGRSLSCDDSMNGQEGQAQGCGVHLKTLPTWSPTGPREVQSSTHTAGLVSLMLAL